jgi:hypothetical protein
MKGISHEAHIAPSELKIEVEMPYPRFAPGAPINNKALSPERAQYFSGPEALQAS